MQVVQPGDGAGSAGLVGEVSALRARVSTIADGSGATSASVLTPLNTEKLSLEVSGALPAAPSPVLPRHRTSLRLLRPPQR